MKAWQIGGLFAAGIGGLVWLGTRTETGQAVVQKVVDVTADVLKTRGYKNNNPLNIRRYADSAWQGMSKAQTDKDFVQFDDPRYGIRAAKIIVENNIKKAKGVSNPAQTIRQLVTKWTATEKDRPAYIKNVAEWTGIGPDQQLTLADVPKLVRAMMRQEIGGVPYADSLISEAFKIA